MTIRKRRTRSRRQKLKAKEMLIFSTIIQVARIPMTLKLVTIAHAENEQKPRLAAAERLSLDRLSREIYTACISIVLDPLKKRCKSGFVYATSTGQQFNGHLSIESIIADTHEFAHASSLKNTYCNMCTRVSKELDGETYFV